MINMEYGSLNESINLGKAVEKVKKIFNKNKDKTDKMKKEFEDKQDDIDDILSSSKGISFSDDGKVSGKYYVANTSEITKNIRSVEDPKKFMLYYSIKDEIAPYVNSPDKLTEDKAQSILNKAEAKRDSLRDEINKLIKSKGEIKKYISTKSFSETSLDASKKIKDSNVDMKKLLDIIELVDKKYQSCFKEDDNFWGSMFKLANFTTKGIDEDAWYLILKIEEVEMEYYYNYTAVYSMLVNTYYNGISDAMEKNVKVLDRISEGPTNESTETLNEFFSGNKKKKSDKKKPTAKPLTPEQLSEVKELKAKIKKIAPKIVDNENKVKDAIKNLQAAIDECLIADGVKAKYKYNGFKDASDSSFEIIVLDKPILNALEVTKKDVDDPEMLNYEFGKYIDQNMEDIGENIIDELGAVNVKVMETLIEEDGAVLFMFS